MRQWQFGWNPGTQMWQFGGSLRQNDATHSYLPREEFTEQGFFGAGSRQRTTIPHLAFSEVEILAPFRIRTTHHAHDVPAGVQAEWLWLAQRLHAALMRERVALLAIALVAAGNKVFPCRGSSARTRQHVIKSQFA